MLTQSNCHNICENSYESTINYLKIMGFLLYYTTLFFFLIMIIGIPLTIILSYKINVFVFFNFNNNLSIFIWDFIFGLVTIFTILFVMCFLFCLNLIFYYLKLSSQNFSGKNTDITINCEL